MLGKPREEHVPALIAGRSRRIREQSLTRPCRLPVILLQELDDQPPSRVEVRLGRDETSKLSKTNRLVTHKHRVANATHSAPLPGRGPLSGHVIGAEATMPGPQANPTAVCPAQGPYLPMQPHATVPRTTTAGTPTRAQSRSATPAASRKSGATASSGRGYDRRAVRPGRMVRVRRGARAGRPPRRPARTARHGQP